LSKTFSKEANPKNFHFDDFIKQTKFGFSQYFAANFILISYKMHTVLVETLKLIVENYRCIYRVSFHNLNKINKNFPISAFVIKGQDTPGVKLNIFPTNDPVQYARSQTNKDYRESSTELINGIYPIYYGKFQYYLSCYKQLNQESDYAELNKYFKDIIRAENILFISQINPGYFERKNNVDCIMMGIMRYELFDTSLYEKYLPSNADWSIEKNGSFFQNFQTEKLNNHTNWRKLTKIYHDDSSITLLFKGVTKNSNFTPKNKDLTEISINNEEYYENNKRSLKRV
jgi:hypothetical protein